MTTVAALFVEANGVYANLPNVEVWDIARDARCYAGPWPLVAHPPCSAWCQLAPVNAARYGHRVGDDGGCFASALASVRQWQGVLEHPAFSYAWPRFGLAEPVRGAWRCSLLDGGWVTEVHQCAYGHRARKATWLYYVGDVPPPPLDWSSPEPTATCSYMTNHRALPRPRLTKREAKATPPAFADLLLAIARSCRAERRTA